MLQHRFRPHRGGGLSDLFKDGDVILIDALTDAQFDEFVREWYANPEGGFLSILGATVVTQMGDERAREVHSFSGMNIIRNDNQNLREIGLEAVRGVAMQNETFTTDEVWKQLGSVPKDRRVLGPIMIQAAKDGICEATNTTRKTTREEAHQRPLTVWKSLIKR